MTEPREIAAFAEEVLPGLHHWRIHNSIIGGAVSSSHALRTADGSVLIDPVRLADDALAALAPPHAIALTERCHQRAAWRYRRQFGATVWLPVDASDPVEEPDRRYAEGDLLPGGLRAIRTPGPERSHYSFLLEGDPGVLFCSDLVMRGDGPDDGGAVGDLRFVPPEYHDDPQETRRSVERLLELPFAVLCLAHGAPLSRDPKGGLRRLLTAMS